MKCEIGQQVETPFGKGKIFDTNNSGDMYHVTLKKDGSTKWFWENYLKPYRTPHEKLLDMGWKHFDEDKMGVIYENEKAYLNIYKTNKYCIFETKASGKYIENKVEINLELSRILTEYMEWLEEEKWNL